MSYRLRAWQQECVDRAISQFLKGLKNFFAIATPGAGKTVMAATVADRLFKLGQIDLVVCFGPSITVINGFAEDLTRITGRPMDGGLGAQGKVLTYQNLSTLSPSFWKLFDRYRVFVIFDEVHHCGGRLDTPSNRWGNTILKRIKHRAQFSLSLSGTPWRTDKLPVVLANYCSDNGRLVCDYVYGIERAIRENVCRLPHIVAIDHDRITIEKSDQEQKKYHGLKELLGSSDVSFQQLLNNTQLIKELIDLARKKLIKIRIHNANAAGLIVASSIEHAKRIAAILHDEFKESSVVVNHTTHDAANIISAFKTSKKKWIVSVGMISEGTNIPRLQVCCYLTRIRTELYFRQVLGRILRAGDELYKYAYMYMLAEPTLVEYAKRVSEDLPDEHAVFHIKRFNGGDNELIIDGYDALPTVPHENDLEYGEPMGSDSNIVFEDEEESANYTVQSKLLWSGHFFQELIRFQQQFAKPLCPEE